MTTVARDQGRQETATSLKVDLRAFTRLLAIVIVCLSIYALFIPRIMAALSPLTGDEPFYVMTALSLAHDGDLDESNNYAQGDYRSFYPPDPLPAGWQGWPASRANCRPTRRTASAPACIRSTGSVWRC